MTGKTIFLKGMFCCLAVALGAMLLDLGKNTISWYEWRSQGTEPIMIVGKLSKLISLEGRKIGTQQLEISTVNENFLLSANLSPKQIRKVRSLNHEINISFIPSPFGIPFIAELSSLNNHTIYYEKKIKVSVWFGVVAFIVWLIFFLLFYTSIYMIIKHRD